LLHLAAALLNGGAIPVTTGDAQHLVAYVGDADGNGSYRRRGAPDGSGEPSYGRFAPAVRLGAR
jgi:hypothetical protein